MASVKVKFRPSTVNGREGTLYYQVIHNRVVRQINTEYKLFVSEWDRHSETVVLHHISTGQERNNYLLSIGSRIKWDKDRLNKIIHALSQSGTFVTDDIVMRFHDNRQELSFNAYISQQIARLKRLGKIRTSETYTAALRRFSGFMNDKEAASRSGRGHKRLHILPCGVRQSSGRAMRLPANHGATTQEHLKPPV